MNCMIAIRGEELLGSPAITHRFVSFGEPLKPVQHFQLKIDIDRFPEI